MPCRPGDVPGRNAFVVTENDPGNATEPGFNHPVRLVPELVAGQAARRPGATAVIAGDTRLTYGELDQSANRLARYLTGLGAAPETLIGVCLERCAEAVRASRPIPRTAGPRWRRPREPGC